MSKYVRDKQRAGARNEPRQKRRAVVVASAEFVKRVEAQRPLTTLQALKDRAEEKGYRLAVFRGESGDWEYTIEGLRGQHVRYPAGGSNDLDLVLLQLELEVAGLPR